MSASELKEFSPWHLEGSCTTDEKQIYRMAFYLRWHSLLLTRAISTMEIVEGQNDLNIFALIQVVSTIHLPLKDST
ncbi:rCG55944 [Rattus norvegicus]|uniref:RCG55944 n=1 Tax=Rattus norvegicus TaxID=10116 RepID=A6JM80_RAT|nr:rCG55944 [Rattus norvegicus]